MVPIQRDSHKFGDPRLHRRSWLYVQRNQFNEGPTQSRHDDEPASHASREQINQAMMTAQGEESDDDEDEDEEEVKIVPVEANSSK